MPRRRWQRSQLDARWANAAHARGFYFGMDRNLRIGTGKFANNSKSSNGNRRQAALGAVSG